MSIATSSKRKLSVALFLVAGLSLSLPAQAQLNLGSVESFARRAGVLINCGAAGTSYGRCAVVVILTVVNFLLFLVASLALAGIVYGGFMYVLSLGDENKSARGKRAILYSVLGLLIAGLAGYILLIVRAILQL